jgi:hypothetical protein
MNIGEPFYTERGKITGPYTYEAIGTLDNVGKIINNGVILTLPLQKDLVFGKGQGVLKTEDTNESATYTFQFIGSFSDADNPHHGSWYFHTESTNGKLAFLNNKVGMTRGDIQKDNEFVTKIWAWK